MNSDRFTDERLRDAFGQMDGIAERGAGCPPSERLVMASRGELGRAEREEVFLHITRCPACAAAWRTARELAAGDESASAPVATRRVLPPRWARLAAAAVLLVAVGVSVLYLLPGRESAPVFREQDDDLLQSTLAGNEPLPRERFVLRWTSGPEGSTYEVVVTTERMELLATGRSTDRPEFQVPQKALDGLESGARVFWLVIAHHPDGRRVESPTFITSVQ